MGDWGGQSLFWFGQFDKESKFAKKVASKLVKKTK